MAYTKTLNINELARILEKHFKAQNVFIESVEASSCQSVSKFITVGLGGSCNLRIEISKRVKGAISCAR